MQISASAGVSLSQLIAQRNEAPAAADLDPDSIFDPSLNMRNAVVTGSLGLGTMVSNDVWNVLHEVRGSNR